MSDIAKCTSLLVAATANVARKAIIKNSGDRLVMTMSIEVVGFRVEQIDAKPLVENDFASNHKCP